MEDKLFTYLWRHSRAEQFRVMAVVLCSLPFYYLLLDLPKLIVNGPIQGKGFEEGAATYFGITLPGWLSGATLFEGFTYTQLQALFVLSGVFLSLVIVNGLFKLRINTMKGRMGERLLRRLRYDLVDRVLRFPPSHFRKTKPAEVASMVKDEVEPIGGFIGEAIATPLFLGGQALTALIFILVQSFWLGLVAFAVVLIQGIIIPRMRRPILALGRKRQLQARELAGRVAEICEGASDIHALDTSNYERADVSRRLGSIYDIRFEIYQRKFFVKFLNNFLAQVTPFIFYSVGGYLAIMGDLSIGQLVAVIAAYKDLPAPIKDLIDWDLQRHDVQIKYEQVIEQFNPEGLTDAALQAPADEPVPPLAGDVSAFHATIMDDSGTRLLDAVSFTFPLAAHVAFMGPPGGGKEVAAAMLARQLVPRSGTLTIGGIALASAPESLTGRRISYVTHDSFVLPHTIRENLLYGLKNQPLGSSARSAAEEAVHQARLAETIRAGNAPYDPDAQWIDFALLGCTSPDGIDAALVRVLETVLLTDDVFRLGLQGRIDADEAPELAGRILEARRDLKERLTARGTPELVEPFDVHRFNRQASIGENLLFGTPVGPAFAHAGLAENGFVIGILRETGLEERLIDTGRQIAETMLELFRDLPPDHPFFAQYSFIAADELPSFQQILQRAGRTGLTASDRARLLTLAFAYVDARHRLGLVDDSLRGAILSARALISGRLPENLKGAIAFHNAQEFNEASSVEDNILFGRVAYGVPDAQTIVSNLLFEAIKAMGLEPQVLRIGLDFQAGSAGKRLSPAQRQKLALARVLLKDPDLLIVNGALVVLDPREAREVMERVLKARKGKGVVWTLTGTSLPPAFDRALEFSGGRLPDTRAGQGEAGISQAAK
ncbi:MAG TPA: ABC transporter transmembrane domain-containing protein [Micropepsaceae bacterium]|nr:ABC transporter transmembrane domain-containing protein [Micropepsaceae bacterium]